MWDPDGVLGDPRPTAWAYLSCPVWYRHAEGQWRGRITEFADCEGFAITRWWVDHENRCIDAGNMLHHMPGSGVRALFLPYPEALGSLVMFRNVSPVDIGRELQVQVFVLDPEMTIPPESTPDLGERARRRGPLALLHRSRASS